MVTKNTSDLFSSIATVTSVFGVKGLSYSRTNNTFCLLFTLKYYCLELWPTKFLSNTCF